MLYVHHLFDYYEPHLVTDAQKETLITGVKFIVCTLESILDSDYHCSYFCYIITFDVYEI